jgi:hypothetical protein
VRGREGRQDAAALRYWCAIAFLEVPEFQQLLHGAITPQYIVYYRNSRTPKNIATRAENKKNGAMELLQISA